MKDQFEWFRDSTTNQFNMAIRRDQGLGAFLAPWELKPEPDEKKKPGAGAAKNVPLLYRLLENEQHKEIVHLLLFFRKNSKFFCQT